MDLNHVHSLQLTLLTYFACDFHEKWREISEKNKKCRSPTISPLSVLVLMEVGDCLSGTQSPDRHHLPVLCTVPIPSPHWTGELSSEFIDGSTDKFHHLSI